MLLCNGYALCPLPSEAVCGVADVPLVELFALVSLCTCFNSSNETANCVFFVGFEGFLNAALKQWQIFTVSNKTTIKDGKISNCALPW